MHVRCAYCLHWSICINICFECLLDFQLMSMLLHSAEAALDHNEASACLLLVLACVLCILLAALLLVGE